MDLPTQDTLSSDSGALGHALDALVRLVEGGSPGLIGSVLLLERDGRLHHGAAPSLPPAYNQAIDGLTICEGVGSCGTAAHRGTAVVVEDVRTDPLWADFRALAAEHGLRACWSTPILAASGEVLGTFAMYHRAPRRPTAHELEIAGWAARVAGSAIERQRAEVALRDEAHLVDTLRAIGEVVTTELDLQKVVQAVTDAATSLTGAEFGAFFYNVTNERGEAYTLYTLSGVPREAFERFPHPRNTAVFDPTFRGIGVVRSGDITQDPRYGHTAPHYGMPPGHLPVRSYLAVPVVSRAGDVLGGLFFGHAQTDRFTERHERIGVGIADWAAVAMDNARLYQGEQRARAAAEAANRAKSEFLTVMSHELRTPLNAMIGYTDLLMMGVPEPVPPQARAQIERIGLSASHLLQLIEEILLFSRIEAGREQVEPREVDLDALVQEVDAIIEPLVREKGIAFRASIRGAPSSLVTDPRKLRQILVNLLGNAVKFTDRGQVVLVLEGTEDRILFRVEDTGIGIPAEHLDHIFEPFRQVVRDEARRSSGTGLGLSVSRRLAHMLGGALVVESALGQGSAFTLSLPRLVSEPGAARDSQVA